MKDFKEFLKDDNDYNYEFERYGDIYNYCKIITDNRFIQIVCGYLKNSIYNMKYEFIGLYDRKEDIFYTADEYRTEKLIEGVKLSSVNSKIRNEYTTAMSLYVDENKKTLKNKGRYLFRQVMEDEENYKHYIKNVARELYIYNLERNSVPERTGLLTDDKLDLYIPNIIEYLKDSSKFIDSQVKRVINRDDIRTTIYGCYAGSKSFHIESTEQYLGYELLLEEAINKCIEEYSKDKDSLETKLRTITKSVKDYKENMKTVTITLKYLNDEITFKYDAFQVHRLYFSTYYINPVSVREEVDKFISSVIADKDVGNLTDEEIFNMISKITYAGKIIYEDENLVLPF